jgi:hypothetical protein
MKCVTGEGCNADLKFYILINSVGSALINGIPFDCQHLVQASDLAPSLHFLESLSPPHTLLMNTHSHTLSLSLTSFLFPR